MRFSNLFIYDALLTSYACQSLVDGVVCSVQWKGSMGQFVSVVPGPSGQIRSQLLQEIQHKRGSRRRLLAVLNGSEVDQDQEAALVPVQQEGALVPIQ
jgi:hypothetical protein